MILPYRSYSRVKLYFFSNFEELVQQAIQYALDTCSHFSLRHEVPTLFDLVPRQDPDKAVLIISIIILVSS